jgi:hypothetical protein
MKYPAEVIVGRDSSAEEIKEEIMKIYNRVKPLEHGPVVINVVLPSNYNNHAYIMSSLCNWCLYEKPFKDPFDRFTFIIR